jgi:demethylmenaquinone methyltransferase/2-methoxy-6-polyprenyl-1,4-benzoquinol methylase
MTIDKTLNKQETPAMFDNIAGTYDKLNHVLSFGLDKRWRKIFVKRLSFRNYNTIIDIASGTGDLLKNLQALNANKYYAIDPASNMLKIAESKVPTAKFIVSTAESLPLENESCDLITVSFGIRNFASLENGFSEFYRVLRSEGIISIMEFSRPRFFLFRWGFIIYLKVFLPIIGRMVSRDKSAYKYLKTSIFDFAKNINVFDELEKQGLKKLNKKNLLFGAVKIYTSKKK